MREAFLNNPNNNNSDQINQHQAQGQILQNSGIQMKQQHKKQHSLLLSGHKPAFTTDQSPNLLLKSEGPQSKQNPPASSQLQGGLHSQSNVQTTHPSSFSHAHFNDKDSQGFSFQPLSQQEARGEQQLQQRKSVKVQKSEDAHNNLEERSPAQLLASHQNSRQYAQSSNMMVDQKNYTMANQFQASLPTYGQQMAALSFEHKPSKEKSQDSSGVTPLQNQKNNYAQQQQLSQLASSLNQPPNYPGVDVSEFKPGTQALGSKQGASVGSHKKANSMMNSKMASILLKSANSHQASTNSKAAHINQLNQALINNFMPHPSQMTSFQAESSANKNGGSMQSSGPLTSNQFLNQLQQQQQQQLSFSLYGQRNQEEPSLFSVQSQHQPQPYQEIGSLVNSSHQNSIQQQNNAIQNHSLDQRQAELLLTPQNSNNQHALHLQATGTKPNYKVGGEEALVELKPQRRQNHGGSNLTGASHHKKQKSMHLQQNPQLNLLQSAQNAPDSSAQQASTELTLQQQQQQLQILQILQNQQQQVLSSQATKDKLQNQIYKKQATAPNQTKKAGGGSSQTQAKASGQGSTVLASAKKAQNPSSSSHHRTKSDNYNNRGSIVISSKPQQLQPQQQANPQKRLTQQLQSSAQAHGEGSAYTKQMQKAIGGGPRLDSKIILEAHQQANSRQIVNSRVINQNGPGVATTGQIVNFNLGQGSIDFSEQGFQGAPVHTQIDEQEFMIASSLRPFMRQNITGTKTATGMTHQREGSNPRATSYPHPQSISGQVSQKQSVHHSKKSSYQNAEQLLSMSVSTPQQINSQLTYNQAFMNPPIEMIPSEQAHLQRLSQQLQPSHSKKKSTKDKYNELKAMYDDLLEKHQATTQILMHQQAMALSQSLNLAQKQMAEEGIQEAYRDKMNANNPQVQQQMHSQNMNYNYGYKKIGASASSASLEFNQTYIPANTPRLVALSNLESNQASTSAGVVMSQQVSHSNLTASTSKQQLASLNLKSMREHQQLSKPAIPNELETITVDKEKSQTKPSSIFAIPAKVIKQAVGKLEEEKQLNPKVAGKMSQAKGQSRKNSSANHKRSVSDGVEQLFKFKQQQQQAMQRYLYPQPSNTTLQTIQKDKSIDQLSKINSKQQQTIVPLNYEEAIMATSANQRQVNPPTSKLNSNNDLQSQILRQNIVPTPFVQPSHHRRVSDDFIHKQKRFLAFNKQIPSSKQEDALNGYIKLQQQQQQQPNQGSAQEKQINLTLSQNYLENVSSEHPSEMGHQLNTADLSVKNFLFEIRNKNSQVQTFIPNPLVQSALATHLNSNNNTDFISIVDERQDLNYLDARRQHHPSSLINSNLNSHSSSKIHFPSQSKNMQRGQFAMIIEGDSPPNEFVEPQKPRERSSFSNQQVLEVQGQIVLQPSLKITQREMSEMLSSDSSVPVLSQPLQTKHSDRDRSAGSRNSQDKRRASGDSAVRVYGQPRSSAQTSQKQQQQMMARSSLPFSNEASLVGSSRERAVGGGGIPDSSAHKRVHASGGVSHAKKKSQGQSVGAATVPTQNSNEKKSNRRLLDNKRSSSPLINQDRKSENLANQQHLPTHKRVKSDVQTELAEPTPFQAVAPQNKKQQHSHFLGNYVQNKKSKIELAAKAPQTDKLLAKELQQTKPYQGQLAINMFNVNSDKVTPKRAKDQKNSTPSAQVQLSSHQQKGSLFSASKQTQQHSKQPSGHSHLNKNPSVSNQSALPFSSGLGADILYFQQQQLSSQLDGSGDKKVVNVSIDLIPDELDLEEDDYVQQQEQEQEVTQRQSLAFNLDFRVNPREQFGQEERNTPQLKAKKQLNREKSRGTSHPRADNQDENISMLVVEDEEHEGAKAIGQSERANSSVRKIERVGMERRFSAKRDQSAEERRVKAGGNQIQTTNLKGSSEKKTGSEANQGSSLKPYTKKSGQLKASARKQSAKSSGQGLQPIAFSGGSDIAARQDKYRKMLSKYDHKPENGSKSNRKSTFDGGHLGAIASSQFNPNQVMSQSSSISPSALAHINNSTISPKGRVSLADPKQASAAKKFQPLHPQQYQINQKLFFPLSPKNQVQPQLARPNNQPSSAQQQKGIQIMSSQAASTKKHPVVGMNPSQQNINSNTQAKPIFQMPAQYQNPPLQVQTNQTALQRHLNPSEKYQRVSEKNLSQAKNAGMQSAGANSKLNLGKSERETAAAPNNSVVQTQESPRSPLQALVQIKFNQPLIMMKEIQSRESEGARGLNGSSAYERIDTLDSCLSENQPDMTPRSQIANKLVRHIKQSFRESGQQPATTVDFYRIGKILGKGAFGKVNLALHKLSGKFAAIKSINKQYLSDESQTKKVMQEVVILKRTRHRNIVRLYEFFETHKHILFVMELCAGGDLLNYVRKRRRLKEEVAKSVFKQIVEGIGYCHSKSILHRDIKLDNILLDSEGEVKICDFGVSKIVKKGEIMTEQCGTPAYIAPEILRDKGYEGFAVDIWSAGVVLFAMLYGTVPFKAPNMAELQKQIIAAEFTLKEDVSPEARQLLTGLLEKSPAKRLTVDQILKHAWLADAEEKVQLFSEQEKEGIRSEYTYGQNDRLNRNTASNWPVSSTNAAGQHLETDPFTDYMLDSTHGGNTLLRNHTTKSVILAPFNSTRSDLQPEQQDHPQEAREEGARETPVLTDSMRRMMRSKRAIKFAAKCREANKQYEANNNAELDNGVYHKDEEEEELKAAEQDQQENPLDEGVDDFGQMERFAPDRQAKKAALEDLPPANFQNFMNILQNETNPSPDIEMFEVINKPHLDSSQGEEEESRSELVIPESESNSPNHPLSRPFQPSSRQQKNPIHVEEDDEDSLQGSFNKQDSSRSGAFDSEVLLNNQADRAGEVEDLLGNSREGGEQLLIQAGLVNRHHVLMNSSAASEDKSLSQVDIKHQSELQKLESLINQQELENHREDILQLSVQSHNFKAHHPSFDNNQIDLGESSQPSFRDNPLNLSLNPYQDGELESASSEVEIIQHRIVINSGVVGVLGSDQDEIYIKDEQPQRPESKVLVTEYSREEEEPCNVNHTGQSPRPGIKFRETSSQQQQNLLATAQTLIVDEEVLQVIQFMGYPRDFIIKCLNNNELNYATAGYYLLQNRSCLSFCHPPLHKHKIVRALQQQQQEEKIPSAIQRLQHQKVSSGKDRRAQGISNEQYIKSLQQNNEQAYF